MTGTGLVQHGTKQHKQKNNGGRYIQGNPVYPFGGHGHLPDKPIQGHPFKGNDIRHIRPEKGIETKTEGNDGQCRTNHSPGCLKKQYRQGNADDNIPLIRRPVPGGDPHIVQHQIKGAKTGNNGNDIIKHRNSTGGGQKSQPESFFLENRIV